MLRLRLRIARPTLHRLCRSCVPWGGSSGSEL